MYKDQLSLTNPRDALHHGERAAMQTNKVDAQCDKFATEVSDNASCRKSPIFSYRTCI